MGQCDQGTSWVRFCHLPHSKRPVHLDKRHREMLRDAAPKEWLTALLPVLSEKVKALDRSPATMAWLSDIIHQCDLLCNAVTHGSGLSQRDRRGLAVTCRSMSLKTLLSTLARSLRVHQLDLGESIERQLHHMRGTLITSMP
eukprot:SRR837773.12783.p1 GENE.SRR837773.12783~~SRR837773.12783.p1  ORF type:complete len:157 (+),score=15.00 SRR837773.12783:48-473(+)